MPARIRRVVISQTLAGSPPVAVMVGSAFVMTILVG
jgi:hypothetical protein